MKFVYKEQSSNPAKKHCIVRWEKKYYLALKFFAHSLLIFLKKGGEKTTNNKATPQQQQQQRNISLTFFCYFLYTIHELKSLCVCEVRVCMWVYVFATLSVFACVCVCVCLWMCVSVCKCVFVNVCGCVRERGGGERGRRKSHIDKLLRPKSRTKLRSGTKQK